MDTFSTVYDTFMAGFEAAGLRRWRSELLGGLSGDVLEIGAGTGANLAHYGPDVRRLVLLEPSEGMRDKLVERAAGREVEVLDTFAETLPLPDASMDAVVFGLVLCSVRDPDRVVAEAFRVLRPGGQAVFVEHVVGHGALGSLHRGLTPLWSRVAGGCQLDRDSGATFERAGFTFQELTRSSFPLALGLVPAIRGVALKPG
ncbi:MAG: class I SAM-dependent methyltransferase [Myxococcales bacterium]|nr:class I SAM-dependent methyltransferase [Myxococcales bacterium]MCB9668324.1 class I SAM-dependent methyltransferase [Alphaproteobacteria bacterium]